MAVKTEPRLIGASSHHVKLDHWARLEKEEVFVTYAAQWRGRPVRVTMSCDRYTYASGELGDWRAYASDAREEPEEGSHYGAHLTDTARHRLHDECKPLVLAWLASDDYADSARGAYYRAALREVDAAEERHYAEATPTARVRRVLEVHANVLGADAVAQLETIADALDVYKMARHAHEED